MKNTFRLIYLLLLFFHLNTLAIILTAPINDDEENEDIAAIDTSDFDADKLALAVDDNFRHESSRPMTNMLHNTGI